MLKYLVFNKLIRTLGFHNYKISNFILPDWQIKHNSLEHEKKFERLKKRGNYLKLAGGHHMDLENIFDFANGKRNLIIDLPGYYFRVEYLPDINICRHFFPINQSIISSEHLKLLEDSILCPIRAAEILKPIHPHYTLTPPQYYKYIQQDTRRKIVFCGQIGNDEYSNILKKTFPDAKIIERVSPYYDFQLCMHANSIVLPISSTFVWTAAYLSNAKEIYMPIAGQFNSKQDPAPNFIVKSDSRYIYDEFPIFYSDELKLVLEKFSRNQIKWKRLNPFTSYRKD